MVTRGCGQRIKGGVYIETRLGEGGKPLEHFQMCPPTPYDMDHSVGVDLIEGPDGKWHIVDWIGEKYYPYAADFLEEGRRFGFSRRVPRNLDFSKLSEGSRILMVHPKGLITNAEEIAAYVKAKGEVQAAHRLHCPLWLKDRDEKHIAHLEIPCHAYAWIFAKENGLMPEGKEASDPAGKSVRWFPEKNPQFCYEVFPIYDPECPKPEYRPAIVATTFITNIAVIQDGESDEATKERIEKQS